MQGTGPEKEPNASAPNPPDEGKKEVAAKAEAKPAVKEAPVKKVVKKVESRRFLLSSSPHLRAKESTTKIMWTVTATLIPVLIASTYFFGLRALILVILGMVSAALTEFLLQKIFKANVTVADGSAVLTGLLVSFNIPAGTPWWIPVAGSFFAIAIGKLPFGGLGYNPLNPALLGRAFLLASWPVHMTKDWLDALWWKKYPGFNFFSWNVDPKSLILDGQTYATPLEVRKSLLKAIVDDPDKLPFINEKLMEVSSRIMDYLIGMQGGCIGETSAILLLLGAAYLLYRGYIDWRTPVSFIGVVAIGGWMFGGPGFFSGDALFHIFAGGLILGAFYMATDMVTTPITKKGRLIFGIGAGLITLMIRLIGGYPEGVSYAILLMNLTTPLIDRYTVPKRFGHVNLAKEG